MKKLKGFTLIELMIVVAIIGILSSIALPAYQDYTKQVRILEGLGLASPPKQTIATGVSTQDDLLIIANNYNNTVSSSKYVDSIKINNLSGVIIIDYNANSIGLSAISDQLTLTPSIRTSLGTFITLKTALSTGKINQIDWACASSTSTTANSRALLVTPPLKPLLSRFAPAECR